MRFLGLAIALLGMVTAHKADAALQAVCSLDRPVIGAGERAAAAVYTDSSNASTMHAHWQASGGQFVPPDGNGMTVTWTPGDAPAGTYDIRADVMGADGIHAQCHVTILLAQATRSAFAPAGELGSEAERDMLVRDTHEAAGYGLYSYILLAERPDESNSERYRAVLSGYLRLEDIRLGHYFAPDQLNASFVPVDQAPPAGADVPWILDHYDFERARFLLARLRAASPDRDLRGPGPFIISALRPLGGEGAPGPVISQNLSTVPLSMVAFWMQQFRSQTTQQRVWQGRSIGSMALNLRTVIAVAAIGLPAARQAVTEWIRY